MSSVARTSTLALQLIASLSDIVGERALRSLVQYAGGELGNFVWGRSPPPRKVATALRELDGLLGLEVVVVQAEERTATLYIAAPEEREEDPRLALVREAIATGFYQGFERSRTGRTPSVTFAPSPTLIEGRGLSG